MNRKKGLVAFSLWGDDPLYLTGALRNIGIWQDSPFDVDIRFYVHQETSWIIKEKLEYEGAQVVQARDVTRIPPKPNQTATFWRFDALKAKEYDYVLMRDVDSRPDDREFQCIDEWFTTQKNYHIIRDHPYHGVPVLAGLWGVRQQALEAASRLVPSDPPDLFYQEINRACNHIEVKFESNDFYQVDQWWLRLYLYPQMRNEICAHDDFFGFERKRFRHRPPVRKRDYSFIGEGFTEFDTPRYPEHRDLLRPRGPRGEVIYETE